MIDAIVLRLHRLFLSFQSMTYDCSRISAVRISLLEREAVFLIPKESEAVFMCLCSYENSTENITTPYSSRFNLSEDCSTEIHDAAT